MPSKVTGHTVSDDGRSVTVHVTHRDSDSFSRSVDPTAMRYANRAVSSWPRPAPGERWACVSGEYGVGSHGRDGRDTHSHIRFEVRP